MATTSTKTGFPSSSFQDTGINTVAVRYLVTFDTVQTDPHTALAEAQAASPDPVPALRDVYPGQTNMFVTSINPQATSEDRKSYYYDVSYQVPSPNEQNPLQQNPNPTLRPGQRNIEYIASEYVVDQARNVEFLKHGGGNGANRSANTLGPIVNAAGIRPDEPIVDTEYNGVLVFTKNYANLGQIDNLNKTYQRTTNKYELFGYEPYRLKYLVSESLGQQFENGIEYWVGQTRVEIKKTTDLVLDNVGYQYWDDNANGGAGSYIKMKGGPDKDEDLSEPLPLKVTGDGEGDNTETITFRHLEPVDYGPLFGQPPSGS